MAATNKPAAETRTELPQPLEPARLTCRQTVLPIPKKAGLAVAAEARGVVSAEGVLGAPSVVVFTGLLVGGFTHEDQKEKQICVKKDYAIPASSVLLASGFIMDTASTP